MITTFIFQNTFMIILFFGMMLLVMSDNFLPKKVRYKAFLILIILFSLILQNHLEEHLMMQNLPTTLITLINVYEYSVRPIIILMFLGMMTNTKYNLTLWGTAIANCILELTSLIPGVHLTFWFDEKNTIVFGPLACVPYIVSLVFTTFLFIEGVNRFHKQKSRSELILLYIASIIFICVILDMVNVSHTQTNRTHWAMSAGCLFYFFYQHINFMNQYQKEQLKKYQNQLMISQIQPHFIFNTMSTIQALCRINPDLASTTLNKFAQYLRNNLDNINQDIPMPLYKELSHTQTYVDIEKIRFPSINVSFEITDENFSLPALTIQPMVENAIRHGVRGLENGEIIVRTYKDGNNHIVKIVDNGRGFELDALTDPQKHIGINNVRERIEKMMGGTLMVESVVGEGTTVTIMIPG